MSPTPPTPATTSVSRFRQSRAGRSVLAAVAVAVLGLTAVGCSDDGGSSSSNRQELIDQMVDEGATEEQATCVADELGDDLDRMINADEADLSDEDFETITEATLACVDLDDLMSDDTTP